jgi:outer membrane immunogenic protein
LIIWLFLCYRKAVIPFARLESSFIVLLSLFICLVGVTVASPARAQGYDWTGFFVGAQAGFARPKDEVKYGGSSTGDPFDADNQVITHRESGFAGGMQAGYNHQFSRIIAGIEADLGYMGFNGSRISSPEFDSQQETRAVSSGGLFGTVTGRVGLSIDRALVYAKGGFAYANLKLGVRDDAPPLTTDATKRSTYTGWTVGGGIEFAITQNWLIKSEYQFIDLGQKSLSAVASDGITDTWKHRPSAHLIKVAINYKF